MKLHHIGLWARDIEVLKEFYIKYFACVPGAKYRNTQKNFESYFLFFEGRTKLELMQRPGIAERERGGDLYGLAHLAVSVGSKEKVDLMTEAFKKDGVPVVSEPRTTGDGYYESVILDPEGNKVEITV